MPRIAILLSLVLLVACSTKAEKVPTCAEVTDHVLALVQVKYPGHGDMGAAGNRDAQVQACEARNMSAKERRCILRAKTMEEVGECRRGSVKAQESQQLAPGP